MSEFKFTSGDVQVHFDSEMKTVLIIQKDEKGEKVVLQFSSEQYQKFVDVVQRFSRSFGMEHKRRRREITGAKVTDKIAKLGVAKMIKSVQETEVNIYIPEEVSLGDQEEITNAAGEFMEALGFELKAQEEPVYHSWWQRIQFIFKRNVTEEDIDRVFRKGKQALEKKYVDLPIAEETEKLANAAEKINSIFEKYANGALRLGSIVYIKQTIDGVPKVLIHQLTSDQVYQLDARPALIKDVEALTKLIENSQPVSDAVIMDSGSVESKSRVKVIDLPLENLGDLPNEASKK